MQVSLAEASGWLLMSNISLHSQMLRAGDPSRRGFAFQALWADFIHIFASHDAAEHFHYV